MENLFQPDIFEIFQFSEWALMVEQFVDLILFLWLLMQQNSNLDIQLVLSITLLDPRGLFRRF